MIYLEDGGIMTSNPNYPIGLIGCKDMEILFISDSEIKVSIGEPRLGVENTATIADPINDLEMAHSYLVIKMPKSAHFKTLIIGLTEDPQHSEGLCFSMWGKNLEVMHCLDASEIENKLNRSI